MSWSVILTVDGAGRTWRADGCCGVPMQHLSESGKIMSELACSRALKVCPGQATMTIRNREKSIDNICPPMAFRPI